MTQQIVTVRVPLTGEQRAQDYIDRVGRRRQRDAARAVRRYRRFADGLFNFALGGFAVFAVFAVLACV